MTVRKELALPLYAPPPINDTRPGGPGARHKAPILLGKVYTPEWVRILKRCGSARRVGELENDSDDVVGEEQEEQDAREQQHRREEHEDEHRPLRLPFRSPCRLLIHAAILA